VRGYFRGGILGGGGDTKKSLNCTKLSPMVSSGIKKIPSSGVNLYMQQHFPFY
jgi:hypothetical protein